MKHMKPLSKRPNMAFDLEDMPVDIEFLIDMMNAIISKKDALNS